MAQKELIKYNENGLKIGDNLEVNGNGTVKGDLNIKGKINSEAFIFAYTSPKPKRTSSAIHTNFGLYNLNFLSTYDDTITAGWDYMGMPFIKSADGSNYVLPNYYSLDKTKTYTLKVVNGVPTWVEDV